MKALIIGATLETERVRTCMRALAAHGIEVALDWTEGRSSESTDDVHDDATALAIVRSLMSALVAADVVWWLVPPCQSQSHVEWAIAMTGGARTITSGPETSRRRLLYRPPAETHFETDDLAVRHLVELARAA